MLDIVDAEGETESGNVFVVLEDSEQFAVTATEVEDAAVGFDKGSDAGMVDALAVEDAARVVKFRGVVSFFAIFRFR